LTGRRVTRLCSPYLFVRRRTRSRPRSSNGAAVACAWLVCATHAVSACSQSGGSDVRPVVRDSAGVRIVENSSPGWTEGDAWSVSAEPLVSIGAVEGAAEYLFSQVTGAVTLADGRLAVGDRGASAIRFYRPGGDYLSSAGGPGQGPGEYIDLAGLARLPGDTIVVVDGPAQRISFLDSTGTYVRSIGLDLAEGFSDVAFYSTVGVLENGRILAYSTSGPGFREEDAGSAISYSLQFFWFRPTGAYGGILASLPARTRWGLQSGAGVSFPYVPFSGGPVAATGRGRFVIGPGVGAEVMVFDAEGRLERRIRWLGPPRAIDSEMIDRWRQTILGREMSTEERENNRRLISDAPLPENLPFTRAILVDESDHIWVEEYRAPWESEPTWQVFDAEGRWLGGVRTPPRLRIYEIGADYLLGAWRDELNVEYVRRYALDRGG